MKKLSMIAGGLLTVVACTLVAGEGRGADHPGLVAHYFADRPTWDGNWPDSVSVPIVDPVGWTFTAYKYSRVEPVVNHLFINDGWFSVRWTGYFDPSPGGSTNPALHNIGGKININPNNSAQNEFSLVLPGGGAITRDMLKAGYPGYNGPGTSVHVKPKGNGNQNSLLVDGAPYTIVNAETYDIAAASMTVHLYNDRVNKKGQAMGRWWIAITAMDATIVCGATAGSEGMGGAGATAARGTGKQSSGKEYRFEIWADDGCRLFIDDKTLIDDWHPAWDKSPRSLRRASPVVLADGKHKIVIEYFQGQNIKDSDADPIKLFWSCPAAGIPRQIVPPACFTHGPENLTATRR